jgi:hypothetical protein
MAFNPKSLPSKVYEAYKLGIGAWPLVLQRAIEAGIKSSSSLADIIYHLNHPDRVGYPIKADETDLINEWKAWRVNAKAQLLGQVKHQAPDEYRTAPSQTKVLLISP